MKIKPVSNKVKAKRLKDLVFSIIEEENHKVPLERKITKHDALTVVERSLNETKGEEFSHRKHKALRDLSDFINLSHKNKTLLASAKNTDLLPIGHPRSTSPHYMTLDEYYKAQAKWLTADFKISEEAKTLIASAIVNPTDSPEHKYAVVRMQSLPQGSYPQEIALLAAFGGGNSFLARRARAMLQRRDRYGRFAWMGGGVRALFRLRIRTGRGGRGVRGGGVRSFTGRYVADSPRAGFIQVENNKGEIFELESKKSEFVKAVLESTPDGFSPTPAKYDSTDPVTDFDSITRVEAPNGWERTDATRSGSYTDGAFIADVSTSDDGKRNVSLKTVEGEELGNFDSWFETQNFLRGREVDIAGLQRDTDGSEIEDSENQWEVPANAYQIGRYVGYLPEGIEDGPEGATDDPRELAKLFTKDELLGGLNGALTPWDENDQATGRAPLNFEGGMQDIRAEAIYQALKIQGEDADLEVARIYDDALGSTNNRDTLNRERREELRTSRGSDADVAEEITRPDIDTVEEPKAEIEDVTTDLPLLTGLTEEERKDFEQSGDYRNYLPTNETPDIPEDYAGLDPEPLDPTDPTLIDVDSTEAQNDALEKFGEKYPIGFTNDPFYMAQRFEEDDLREAFVESISPSSNPGYGTLTWLDDEGDSHSWLFQGEALRDALQLRGVDTNQLTRETYDEGRVGQEGVIPEREAEDILREEGETLDDTTASEAEIRQRREVAVRDAQELMLGEDVERAISEGAGREELLRALNSQPFNQNNPEGWSRWDGLLHNLDTQWAVDLPRQAQRDQWRSTQGLKNYLESLSFEEIERGDTGPEIPDSEKKIARPAGVAPDDSRLEGLREEIAQIVEGLQIPNDRTSIEEIDKRREIAQDIVNKETLISQSEIEGEVSDSVNERVDELNQIIAKKLAELENIARAKDREAAENRDKEILQDLRTNRAINSNDPQEIRNVIEESEIQRRTLPTGEENENDPYIVSASGIDLEFGDVIVRDHFVVTGVEAVQRVPRGIRVTGSLGRTGLRTQYVIRGYYPGHEEQIYPEALTATKQIRVIKNGNPPEPGDRGRLNQPDPEDYLDGRQDSDYKAEYKRWKRDVLAAKRRYLPPQNLDEYAWVEDLKIRDGFWYNFVMWYSRSSGVNARVQRWARRLQLVENAARETSTNIVNAVDGTELGVLNTPRVLNIDNEQNEPAETRTDENLDQGPQETIAPPENPGNIEIEIPRTQKAWNEYAQLYWEEMVSDDPMPDTFPEALRENHGIPPFGPQDGARLELSNDEVWRWQNPDGTVEFFDPLDPSQTGEMENGRIYNSVSKTFGYQNLPLETRRAEVVQRIDAPATPIEDLPQIVDGVPTQTPTPTGNQPLILEDGEIASTITDIIPTPKSQRSPDDATPINANGERERVRSLYDGDRLPSPDLDPYRAWQERNFIYGDGIHQIAIGDKVNHWGQSNGNLRGLGEGTVVGIEGIENPDDRFRQAYAYVWYPNALQFDDNDRPIMDSLTGEQKRGTIKKHAVRMLFLNARDPELEREYLEAGENLRGRPRVAELRRITDRFGFDERAYDRYDRLGRVRYRNPQPAENLPEESPAGQESITSIENLPPLRDGVPEGAPESSPTPAQTPTFLSESDILGNSIANRFLDRPADTRTPVGGIASFDGTTPGVVEENFDRVSPNRVTENILGQNSAINYRSLGWSPETAARVSHAANNRDSAQYIRSLLNDYETNPNDLDLKMKIENSVAQAYGADGSVSFGESNLTLGLDQVNIYASSGTISLRFSVFDSDGNEISGTRVGRELRLVKNADGTVNLSQKEEILLLPDEYQNSKFGEAWKLYYDNWFIANGASYSETDAFSNAFDFAGAYIWSGQGYGWSKLTDFGDGRGGYEILRKAKSYFDSEIRNKQNKTDADLRAIRDWDQTVLKASTALLQKNIAGKFKNEEEFLESTPTRDLNSAYIVGNSIYYRDEQTLGDGSFNIFTENDLFSFAGTELLRNMSEESREEALKNFPTPRDIAFVGKDPYEAVSIPKGERKELSWFGKDFLTGNVVWLAKKRYAPDDISLLQQQAEAYELKRREGRFEQANATFGDNEFTKNWFSNIENYSESLKPYADEINSMLNNPTSDGRYTVSLLSPAARRVFQNELNNMLRDKEVRDMNESSVAGIVDMLNAINKDRAFFENPLTNDDDPVLNIFRQLSNNQIEEFFNADLDIDNRGGTDQIPVVINGEEVPNLVARIVTDGGINLTFELQNMETRQRYYLKKENFRDGGARSEFVVNRLARNLEILGVPNLDITGEDETTGLSNWVISTNAGGNLNSPFLSDEAPGVSPARGQFSVRPGDMPETFNFERIPSPGGITDIETISVVNMAVLDALVDNTDRNSKNSLLLINRPEGLGESNQKWQAVPIDNAQTLFADPSGVFDLDINDDSITSVEQALFRPNFSDYDYRSYLAAQGAQMGPVALKALIDSRLEILRNNIRSELGGGWISQKEFDFMNARIESFKEITVDAYDNFIKGRGSKWL
jgi:hypothetical protein